MLNKILPVQKEETVNYGQEKINDFWMLKDGPITRSTPKQFITQFIKNTDRLGLSVFLFVKLHIIYYVKP